MLSSLFVFQAEGCIRDLVRARVLGDVYKRQGRAMVRDPRHKLPSAVDAVEVGCEDGGRLRELLSGVDAIVHLAGKVSRDPKDSAAMHHLPVE